MENSNNNNKLDETNVNSSKKENSGSGSGNGNGNGKSLFDLSDEKNGHNPYKSLYGDESFKEIGNEELSQIKKETSQNNFAESSKENKNGHTIDILLDEFNSKSKIIFFNYYIK